MYNFYCTGDEARLTDCVITNSNICGKKRVGLVCETGNISLSLGVHTLLDRKMLQINSISR